MSIEECSTSIQGWDELNPALSWKGRMIEPLRRRRWTFREAKSFLRSHSKLDFIPEAFAEHPCGARRSTRHKGMTATNYTLEYPWNFVCTLRVCLRSNLTQPVGLPVKNNFSGKPSWPWKSRLNMCVPSWIEEHSSPSPKPDPHHGTDKPAFFVMAFEVSM